eukprot:1076221-Prymnesium_polylepis.1
MKTLKRTIDDEKLALRKQLEELEQRHAKASEGLAEVATGTEKVARDSPGCAEGLVEKGVAYKAQGQNKYASLLFMSAIKLCESIGAGKSLLVVRPISELADLYSIEGMEEEAIA